MSEKVEDIISEMNRNYIYILKSDVNRLDKQMATNSILAILLFICASLPLVISNFIDFSTSLGYYRLGIALFCLFSAFLNIYCFLNSWKLKRNFMGQILSQEDST